MGRSKERCDKLPCLALLLFVLPTSGSSSPEGVVNVGRCVRITQKLRKGTLKRQKRFKETY